MSEHDLPRRTFLGRAAGAGALAAAGAAGQIGGAEETPDVKNADLSAAKPADLLLALIRQLDRQRLSEEHLAVLRGDVEYQQRRSAVLSHFPLTNADEPAPVFRAWRAEG